MQDSGIHVVKGQAEKFDGIPQVHPKKLNDMISDAHALFDQYRGENPNSVLWTPLLESSWLSDSDTQVFVKLETEQITNSFKVRGAINRVHFAVREGTRSIVTASTGNHAMAVVHALKLNNAQGLIFLPSTANPGKVAALRAIAAGSQVDIRFAGDGCLQAELAAAKYAQENNALYVSPYNDPLIIAGQGTIGVEILSTLSKMCSGRESASGTKCCYITAGGGGLLAGIAASLKEREPGAWRVVGCLPHNSPPMYDCMRAGKVVESKVLDTLSDGSAGNIEEDAITVPLCASLVDAWALINESDIAAAIRGMFLKHRKVVEGAAAVSIAGFQKDEAWRKANKGDIAVIVACGGNIEADTFVRVVSKQ